MITVILHDSSIFLHISPYFPYQNWAAAAKTPCPELDAQHRAPGPSGAVGLDQTKIAPG
jgi:hypothetical protein